MGRPANWNNKNMITEKTKDSNQGRDEMPPQMVNKASSPIATCQSPTKDVTFGQALIALKAGQRACREGWNGKGMFVFINSGSVDYSGIESPNGIKAKVTHIEGVPANLFDRGDTDTHTRLPSINMRSATGSTVTGWLASQTDMLAEDWMILYY